MESKPTYFLISLMLICLLAGAQSPEPWYNTTYVNEDKPGSTYRFSFVQVTDTHIGEGIGG
ncbi:MAG: hypothetical protein GY751_21050 [Bacteroidetes bacterium]|nr:hypothetical protein [Bacteroidota bacterium]